MARESRPAVRAGSCAVAVLAMAATLAGCGVSDGLDRLGETIDESLDDSRSASGPVVTATSDVVAPRWAEYANETGLFTVDLPDQPNYTAIEQDGLTINSWSAESGSDSYGIGELVLKPLTTYDFESGVLGAVDSVVDSVEDQLGQSAGSELVDESPEVRDGYVGVRFVANITVEDDPYAILNGAVYDTGDIVVLLTMIDVDGDNPDGARRFIESLDLAS